MNGVISFNIFMSKTTLKQLAKELNLSISTVSKALKNSYEINEKTIAKVKALAKKHNYRPNRMALNLKQNETKTIGVIIPNILNYFFSKVLLGIEEEANKNGYQIIICLSNNKYSKEAESLQLLSDGSVDGFILSIAKETQINHQYEHFASIIDDGFPIVMFDRVSNNIECDKVIINDFDAAYQATSFLINQGRKKIAIISTIDDLNIGKSRINGYKKALKDSTTYTNEAILVTIRNKKEYENVIATLFNIHKDIDGIFTTGTISAITALKIAQYKGYQIPKDISIIGFSDSKISRLSSPPLTTVSQNALEIGKKAVKSLINRLQNPKSEFQTEVIETKLLQRKTS